MKSLKTEDEIENAKVAIKKLGGEIESINNFTIPFSDLNRTAIIIKKVDLTPKAYPRKAGTPSKNPIK